MATNKKTQKPTKPTRGRTTRQGSGRRTTRRRPKWLPDDEPVPASPKAEEPSPEPAPVLAPPAPARPIWGAGDWVSVRYTGPDWYVHPKAGVFVPGTTTRLRGDLARELPNHGFQFQVSAMRRAG